MGGLQNALPGTRGNAGLNRLEYAGTWREKHHGYQYEHRFSQNWTAMKGYHFLMHLGHLINVLSQWTTHLAQIVRRRGVRGLIQFIRETCKGPWLDADRIRQLHASPLQLRLE